MSYESKIACPLVRRREPKAVVQQGEVLLHPVRALRGDAVADAPHPGFGVGRRNRDLDRRNGLLPLLRPAALREDLAFAVAPPFVQWQPTKS